MRPTVVMLSGLSIQHPQMLPMGHLFKVVVTALCKTMFGLYSCAQFRAIIDNVFVCKNSSTFVENKTSLILLSPGICPDALLFKAEGSKPCFMPLQ